LIEQIAIAGYRSIRSIILRLGQFNIVTGANGSGKSNLYRALKLIADGASGRLAESLAREGGFNSVRWAGPKPNGKDPVSVRLGFLADPFSYCLDVGLPIPQELSAFNFDPKSNESVYGMASEWSPKPFVRIGEQQRFALEPRTENG
jgi:predicted ATPase